jgi:hypothetical protein
LSARARTILLRWIEGTEYRARATWMWWSGCTLAFSTQTGTSKGSAGAGSMAGFSVDSNSSRGTARVVPWTRSPATSRHQVSALWRASPRPVKVSPSNQLSRT